MENPLHWGPVRKTINEVIVKHATQLQGGIIGLSLESSIYNKLLERGYVIDESPGHESSDGQIKHDLLATLREWATALSKAAMPLRNEICEAAEHDKAWEDLAEALFGKDWHKPQPEEEHDHYRFD